MKRPFFSQSMRNRMVEAGKLTVEKIPSTMLAGDHAAFPLVPASRFVKTTHASTAAPGRAGQLRPEQAANPSSEADQLARFVPDTLL